MVFALACERVVTPVRVRAAATRVWARVVTPLDPGAGGLARGRFLLGPRSNAHNAPGPSGKRPRANPPAPGSSGVTARAQARVAAALARTGLTTR